MLLARTDAQVFSSPGLYVIAGAATLAAGVFFRMVMAVTKAMSPGRWGGRWESSRRAMAGFIFVLGALMLVGGLIALAVTGRFFVG